MNIDRLTPPRAIVVLVRNDGTELLLQTASPDELPPLAELPLLTEPHHFGRTVMQPAPQRTRP